MSRKKILGIIPARHASTRFPAKPLVDIGGKPMIQRVYEQVKKCGSIDDVVVATDHEEIYSLVEKFEGTAVMTKESHKSGTDRCHEALELKNQEYEYVVNIQGDEPFINPKQITELTNLLDGVSEIATLIKEIETDEDIFNPNIVKVVKSINDEGIYFSRSPIPFQRNTQKSDWIKKTRYYKHIGIYAYRTDILKKITKLPVSNLENAESLEQLRWIENGFTIKVTETSYQSIGIDTPEDLKKIKDFY